MQKYHLWVSHLPSHSPQEAYLSFHRQCLSIRNHLGELSSKYKPNEICDPDVHTGMQSRNLHFHRLFSSRWLSAGRGETIFGEIVPQRDRGLLAQPPLLALRLPSSFFSTHGLATFVTDVARPSAHNPKTKPTKATNTRWNFTLRNCSAICVFLLCAEGSGLLWEVVFDGKIENES